MDDPKLLYVSDDPELIRTPPGCLFQAKLPTNGDVARILVDHANKTSDPDATPPLPARPVRIIAWIVNRGPAAGVVQLVKAVGQQSTNGLHSGHTAVAAFLKKRELVPSGGVESVPIAKDAVEPLIDTVLAPNVVAAAGKPAAQKNDGECITGLFDVQCDTVGNTYEVRIIACGPDEGIDVFERLTPAAGDGKHRRGVFVIDGAGEPVTVKFGGAPIVVGDTHYPRSPDDPYAPGPDYRGEFGVTKRFACEIDGGSAGRIAMLAQRAGGGRATATYLIEGGVYESAQNLPTEEFVKVLTFQVAPNTKHTVKLTTMAEINATLPIDLLIAPNVSEIRNRITQTG